MHITLCLGVRSFNSCRVLAISWTIFSQYYLFVFLSLRGYIEGELYIERLFLKMSSSFIKIGGENQALAVIITNLHIIQYLLSFLFDIHYNHKIINRSEYRVNVEFDIQPTKWITIIGIYYIICIRRFNAIDNYNHYIE